MISLPLSEIKVEDRTPVGFPSIRRNTYLSITEKMFAIYIVKIRNRRPKW